MDKEVLWQWRGDGDVWTAFPENVAKNLEAGKKSGLHKVQVDSQRYVDLGTMTQLRNDSHGRARRPVRRVEVPRATPAPLPLPPPPPPSPSPTPLDRGAEPRRLIDAKELEWDPVDEKRRFELEQILRQKSREMCDLLHSDSQNLLAEAKTLAARANQNVSDLLDLDWKRNGSVNNSLIKLETPPGNVPPQNPLRQTHGLIEVGNIAQAQFRGKLLELLRLSNMHRTDLMLGPVKTLARLKDKALSDQRAAAANPNVPYHPMKYYDINRATVLCGSIPSILALALNLSRVGFILFICKNKFKVNLGDKLEQPPCLFLQLGMKLEGGVLLSRDDLWIVELQLTTRSFYTTKQISHLFYEIWRCNVLPDDCPMCEMPRSVV